MCYHAEFYVVLGIEIKASHRLHKPSPTESRERKQLKRKQQQNIDDHVRGMKSTHGVKAEETFTTLVGLIHYRGTLEVFLQGGLQSSWESPLWSARPGTAHVWCSIFRLLQPWYPPAPHMEKDSFPSPYSNSESFKTWEPGCVGQNGFCSQLPC